MAPKVAICLQPGGPHREPLKAPNTPIESGTASSALGSYGWFECAAPGGA